MTFSSPFVRTHLAVLAVVTGVTAWFSYAYFHIDEYFQIIELVRYKLGQVGPILPWEHSQRMRPWLQPFLYWTVARGLGLVGVQDVFDLAFAFRLLTGLANVVALALFLRTTLPWMGTEAEQRLHVRVVTLLGFLPYLFVRTSSETGSMAAVTAGWALLLDGAHPARGMELEAHESRGRSARTWDLPRLREPWRVGLVGLLFGFAFEMRFQTAFIPLGIVAWLIVVGKARVRRVLPLFMGGVIALSIGALVDRWGYGEWTLPPWNYFEANVLEGAAGFFGTEPPFAYVWMLPANIFFPVVLLVLVLAVLAWFRCPMHPLTWTTLPFFVVHNLLSHKEERFLFPLAIFSTAFVVMAIGPSSGRPLRVASFGWERRGGFIAKLLAATSFASMAFVAFVPLGWHHNVRVMRYLRSRFGDELHATVMPDIDLNLPAFHPRIYDVDKLEPAELERRVLTGTARKWLISDRPIRPTGVPGLDEHLTREWSELPIRDPSRLDAVMKLVDAYNARARPPLRRLRFRTLYRVGP